MIRKEYITPNTFQLRLYFPLLLQSTSGGGTTKDLIDGGSGNADGAMAPGRKLYI